MQSLPASTFEPLIAAEARLLVTCVVAGAASLAARILHSRAKKHWYPAMSARRVQLWTFAYDSVLWLSGLAVALMFMLFLQVFGS
jgi:hypothetical protein